MINKQTRRSFVARLVAASAATALATRSSGAGEPETHLVEITGFKFEPERIEVKAGDKINWVNRDIVPHTATATDESWDTGELSKGQERSITITAVGEQDYFCRFHPSMKAQVVIKG